MAGSTHGGKPTERTAHGEDRQALRGDVISASGVFEGSEDIAIARGLVLSFLAGVQATHGLPVSERAMGTVRLVVGELVTNARQYAPGPRLLTLEVNGGSAAEVTVRDSDPTPPAILPPDPTGRRRPPRPTRPVTRSRAGRGARGSSPGRGGLQHGRLAPQDLGGVGTGARAIASTSIRA
ncbi:hypothetical protein ABZ371_02605 [Streptomyces sp. NPDC005899]|uniref:hypothetical protein n=1 Tax=Streptomyces sp. NPDC005899 TaxID=3155716 RepID=UPI0033F9B319